MGSRVLLCLLLVALIILVSAVAWKPVSMKVNVQRARATAAAIAVSLGLSAPREVLAVSGGGIDYATQNLKESSFAGKKEIGKDFTQCDAQGVNFQKAVLKGSRFYRANLGKADFTSADLSTASIEDAGLEGTIFTDANLSGAYISASIVDSADISKADFSEALMPEKTTKLLCARADAIGTNTQTGVDTRDSLLCP